MNKALIEQLDYKAQQWLYKAIARMVLADHKVEPTEIRDFKMAMSKLTGSSDERKIKEWLTHPDFMAPLKPMHGLNPAHGWIIFSEVAQVAASDADLHGEEEEFLKHVIGALGIPQDKSEALVKWTKKLAHVKSEEASFKAHLGELFPGNRA